MAVNKFIILGAKVYMACRSVEKAEAAARDIKDRTNVNDERLIVMKLNLGSIASIKQFYQEFSQCVYHSVIVYHQIINLFI